MTKKMRLIVLCCRTFSLHHLLFGFETVKFLGARVNKLIMAGEVAAVYERIGKLSLGFSGYRYGIHGRNSKLISWARVKNAVSAKRS